MIKKGRIRVSKIFADDCAKYLKKILAKMNFQEVMIIENLTDPYFEYVGICEHFEEVEEKVNPPLYVVEVSIFNNKSHVSLKKGGVVMPTADNIELQGAL